MTNLSKTIWLPVLLIAVFLVAGVFVYQWWQTREEMEKIEPEEKLTTQSNELGKVTIITDKTEYEQGEIIKITMKNGLKESIFSHIGNSTPICGIECIERKTSEGNWEKLIPVGSNLEILVSISEAKESVNNLIIVLDELYETIESGNGTEIEAQVREYLNISKIAIEKVSKASSSLEDVTSICTSLEDYHQMKSNLYDAEIDMETDDMLLGFYLYAYFEEPGSTTALDKVRNQINKVKTSAYSVEDSFSAIIDASEEINPGQSKTFEWIPLIRTKTTSELVQAPPGIYRLSILYENHERPERKSIYTNEFRIR